MILLFFFCYRTLGHAERRERHLVDDLMDVGAHVEAPDKRCRGQDGACWSNGDVRVLYYHMGYIMRKST